MADHPPSERAPGQYDFEANGLKLAYTLKGQGPLIVVQVPGWGIGSAYLQSGLSFLEEHFTVLYFSPRGTGRSSRPASPTEMSTQHMSCDLEQLRLQLGVSQISLVGHSNGGSIALGYAERFPLHVSKLLLIDHSLQSFGDSATWKKFALERAHNPVYADALAAFQSLNPTNDEDFQAGLRKILPYYFSDPSTYVPVLAEAMTDKPSLWCFGAQQTADRAAPMPQVAELENVTAKTMLVVGREDAFCSVRTAERTREGIEGAELVVLEGCGHFPWIERGEEFRARVRRFLND